MKKNIFYLVLIGVAMLMFCGCETIKTKPISSLDMGQLSGPDGFSEENAIVMQSKNEGDGIKEEYGWIYHRYPGSKVESQALLHGGKKIYDLMNVRLKDGTGISLYFDITGYFGKW